MSLPIKGILPALLTPFTEKGDVDIAALERLIARLYSAGVDGLYICGQTGEGLAQSAAMRKTVLETAVRCSPSDKLLIAHVGANRAAEALELARHAEGCGVHAISSLPPSGPYSFAEIQSYYATLAAATTVPLVLYYFPAAAPGLSSDHVIELCGLPNVAGVKFTSLELHRIADLKRAGAMVFNGYDEVLAAGLLMGADGGIGSFYNVAPELVLSIHRAALRGAWSEARRGQDRLNALITLVLKYPAIPALKKMLEWSGLPCGPALAPRRALTAEEERSLRAALEKLEFGVAAA